jgi:hypothetical protein
MRAWLTWCALTIVRAWRVAYAAASFRPRPRFFFFNAAGLRITHLAFVMHYSLGTRAQVICTR